MFNSFPSDGAARKKMSSIGNALRMNLAEYRDVTYEMDKDFDKTVSWSYGLNEEHRFVPHLQYAVRRTNSSNDIDRYKRYFSLARSNQGRLFTWRYYLKILKEELRHFDTGIIMTQVLLKHAATTPVNSEVSTYITASDSDSVKKKTSESKRCRKLTFKRKKVSGDAESISSMDDISISSNLSLTPQANLLKKMCTDIRTLARKTCKTVEKMATKSKFCSACGDYIGNVKIHKDCSQPFPGANKCNKTMTPTVRATTTIAKPEDTLLEAPKGGGELPVDKLSKMTLAPSCGNTMKPFIKKSPKEVIG